MKTITILGSTGSIGVNALDIIRRHPEKFRVGALAAWTNMEALAAQIEEFRPKVVSVADAGRARLLRSLVAVKVKIGHGTHGALECAGYEGSDLVVSAMVGAAGLAPTVAAIKAGKTIALANKEAMVTAGEIVIREARASKVKIIPVDSEHSAIFQVLRGEKRKSIKKVVLTASCGPFLKTPLPALDSVTVEQALRHPNWSMGRKITIDSATMMNKGLEVIEARWLFNLPVDKIDVVGHPQSIVHSLVEFHDSSIIAQMGPPDMRGPISFALNFPDREENSLPRLDIMNLGQLSFIKPDPKRFPALPLAFEALKLGPVATASLNAANEVAVEAFLAKKISFTAILKVCDRTLKKSGAGRLANIAEALETDKSARAIAREAVKELSISSPYPS